jgi:hypothetical protein
MRERRPTAGRNRPGKRPDMAVLVQTRVPRDVHDRLMVLAAANHDSLAAWLRRLLIVVVAKSAAEKA